MHLIQAGGQNYSEDSIASDPFMCLWYEQSLNDEKLNEYFLHQAVMSCKCSVISACFLSRQHTRAGYCCLLSPQELLVQRLSDLPRAPSGDVWDLPEKQATIQCAIQYSQCEGLEEKKPTYFTNSQFFMLADLLKYLKASICSYPFTQQLTSKSAKATAVNDITLPTTICSHHKSSLCWI